jgi:toxin ParE1/3/4
LKSLDFTADAREHLAAIGEFIADGSNSEIADRFVAALVAKCTKLASLPGTLGSPRPDLNAAFRSTPHKGYIIYFRYVDDLLEVIGILDAHRDAATYFTGETPES